MSADIVYCDFYPANCGKLFNWIHCKILPKAARMVIVVAKLIFYNIRAHSHRAKANTSEKDQRTSEIDPNKFQTSKNLFTFARCEWALEY